MRVAIAQINPHMGAFEYNSKLIVEYSRRAEQKRADLVVFGELALFGYSPYDLLERPEVTASQMKWLKKTVQALPKNLVVIFGAIVPSKNPETKPFYNAAIVVKNRKIIRVVSKHLLPSYDIFDDTRFFEPSDVDPVIKIPGIGTLGVSICEDMWTLPRSAKSPLRKVKKVDLLVNLSASPFSLGHNERRIQFAKGHAKTHKTHFLYSNIVGGQDESVFDGRSFLMDSKGKIIVQASMGSEDLVLVDLETKRSEHRPQPENKMELLRNVLVLGLRDFVRKTGQKRVHLGLSGGIDSSLVACLAVDALGPGQVSGLLLPGPFSSDHSLEDAKLLAGSLGIEHHVVSINEAYNLISNSFPFPENSDIVSQNFQARLRGLLLMGFSNARQSLLLNTSNKSELAAGYSTLYGDLCGSLCVIGDLTKNQVYDLARHFNGGREIIPIRCFSKPPSAELAPNQKDQDSLPPYKDLDSAVVNLIEKMKAPKNETENWLNETLLKTEFKRWQAPPILRVSRHAFGRGRRLPIAHGFRK